MKKLQTILDKASTLIAAVLCAVMMVILLTNVVLRLIPGIGGILFLGGGSTVTIAQRMFEGMNSWALLAIPLYTFAGYTMSKGGISERLMDFCYSLVGHIYGGLVYRELTWEDIKFAFADTVRVSGRIFIVIAAARLYTIMLTTAGFDKWMANTMLGFSTNPTVILIMILLLFFIVTMFMESIATLTLFTPILFPIAMSVGIDPVVLCVLITVVIGIGLVTPPVGMCIYVACDLQDITVGEVFPTLIPFLAATFVCIALMIAFPQLILLPTYLMA